MNIIQIFIHLLIVHLLGDFYFQTQELADKKTEQYTAVLKHSVIYAGCFAVLWMILSIAAARPLNFYMFVWCAGLHWVIDSGKFLISKDRGNNKIIRTICAAKEWIFVTDQFLHLVCLIWSAYQFSGLLPPLSLQWKSLLPYILYFLLLAKPANILFKIMFESYEKAAKAKFEAQDEYQIIGLSTQKGAGAWIGTMERWTIAILILANQFSAIGMILTAKSVARFKKMESSSAFAEYFLIGTMFSLLWTVACYAVIFKALLPMIP